MEKFKRVSIVTQSTISIPDHQTLLSFTDDDGSEAFQEWWDEEGSSLFNEWAKNSTEFKHIVR
jgi:hypothetical protein